MTQNGSKATTGSKMTGDTCGSSTTPTPQGSGNGSTPQGSSEGSTPQGSGCGTGVQGSGCGTSGSSESGTGTSGCSSTPSSSLPSVEIPQGSGNKMINLTGRTVKLSGSGSGSGSSEITIPSCGIVARIKTTVSGFNGSCIGTGVSRSIEGLPSPEGHTTLIVSDEVRSLGISMGRTDLVSPATTVEGSTSENGIDTVPGFLK